MVASTPMEEVQSSLVVAREMAVKEARDFFRVEWVEGPNITMLSEGLEEVAVLMEMVVEAEAEEVTLVEVAEIMKVTPVGEGEDPTMLEKINRVTAVIKQLDMVR